ncbi:MAG TPA: hypothetical protein VF169_16980 [Albitalea sp.]|uniref:tetratricopeptide repeat protein n=1 Tax=Piscinibacter sp. TaxID=1903157 RepID=UPI002ED45501
MTAFVLVAVLLGLVATALLTRPLWRRSTAEGAPPRAVGLAGSLAVFVLAIAAGGYAWVGTPGQLGIGPGSAAEGDAERRPDAQQVAALIDQLAERLKARPDDAQGWQLMARAQSALGRTAEAVDSYRKAARLRPDDATILADLAVAIAVADKNAVQGEPVQLVERALKLDARNVRALAFAGMLAFDRKDYPGAVRYWETLSQVEPADSPFAGQIRGSIAQARQLAGMPPAAEAAAPAPAGGGRVSGTVTLSPRLAGKVAPGDTVFVFARAVEGPRVPLAILRKQVKDLPLQFTLDDSMAMSPAAKLSSAGKVVVGARISKSGNAMPQPGDLQGFAPASAVGASGLAVEIADEVTSGR